MTFTTIDTSLTPIASMGYQNVPNMLDNGGFEIWQRGTTFTNPANNAFTADRWYLAYTGSFTGTVSQNSATVDSGLFSYQLVTTNVASLTSGISIGQNMELWPAGKPITVSVRINSNVSGINIDIQQNGIGSGTSGSYSANTGWQTLSATYTPTGNSNPVRIYVNCPALIQTTYIDSAMLVVGSTSIPFVQTNPQVDLSRCQRYYEISSQPHEQINPIMRNSSTNISSYWSVPFITTKRVAPTVTFSSQSIAIWTLPGVGNLAGSNDTSNWNFSPNPGLNGFYAGATRTAGDQTAYQIVSFEFSWTASADV